jgi:hypothetical protein
MSLAIRVAAEAAAVAFALALLVTTMLYRAVGSPDVIGPTLALSSVACVTVFLAVFVVVRRRFRFKSPVLGAKRGAGIGMLAVVVVASAHTCFTYGAAGFLYSLLAQVGAACLVGGGPAAFVGAVLGRSIERSHFSVSGT